MAISPEVMLYIAVGFMVLEGVPLSVLTYLVLTGREAAARVEEIFFLHSSGVSLAHRGRSGMEDVDEDIFTSMLLAVVSFIKDSFSKLDDNVLEKIEFGKKRIYIQRGSWSYLVAIYEGDYITPMKEELQGILDKIELGNEKSLSSFRGSVDDPQMIEALLDNLILEHQKDKKQKKKDMKAKTKERKTNKDRKNKMKDDGGKKGKRK